MLRYNHSPTGIYGHGWIYRRYWQHEMLVTAIDDRSHHSPWIIKKELNLLESLHEADRHHRDGRSRRRVPDARRRSIS